MSNKTIAITLSGGFHNSKSKTIRATIKGDAAYISERQARDLQNHFCGSDTCACGGAARATKFFPTGWTFGESMNGGDYSVCAVRTDYEA